MDEDSKAVPVQKVCECCGTTMNLVTLCNGCVGELKADAVEEHA